MVTFHQQVLFDIGALVVAVVVRVFVLTTIRNPKYYARRQQGRRRRRDENEDDKHGDKDNEDDDDDAKMPAENDVISRPFRTNIVFPLAFSNSDGGEGEEGGGGQGGGGGGARGEGGGAGEGGGTKTTNTETKTTKTKTTVRKYRRKSDVISRPFRSNIVFPFVFAGEDGGEGEEEGVGGGGE